MTNRNRRRIKVAISCDGETIPRRHFGDCPHFRVYEIYEDGECRLICIQDNTSPEEKVHADPKKLKKVTSILPGCEVVVSGLASPNFVRMRDTKPIQPVVTNGKTISETLSVLLEAFEDLFGLVDMRRRGDHPKVILTIGEKL